jgi:hypothetical protein
LSWFSLRNSKINYNEFEISLFQLGEDVDSKIAKKFSLKKIILKKKCLLFVEFNLEKYS